MKILGKLFAILGAILVLVFGLLFFMMFKSIPDLEEFVNWQDREAFIEDFNKNGSVDMKKYPFLYDKGFRSVGVTSIVKDGTPTNCMFINTNEKNPFSDDKPYKLLQLCNDGSMNYTTNY